MKPSTIFLSYAAVRVLAHPGMNRVLDEIQSRDDFILSARSNILLGDLLKGAVTAIGGIIKNVLQQGVGATDNSPTGTPAGPLGSSTCTKDPLCVWYYIADEMWSAFADQNGCTDLGRGAIRQGFHDAAAWDVNSPYGGADGSLLLSDELSRPENQALQEIGAATKAYYSKYHQYGAGMADIIQLGAIVGTVACPGGPRIRAFVGRTDDSRAAPQGKLPTPFMDAPTLIDLFSKKTFTASDLVALVGAHSSARQRFVDPSRAGAPLDSDPQIWDASFYRETLTGNNRTFFILPSDKALATYWLTGGQWISFASIAGPALITLQGLRSSLFPHEPAWCQQHKSTYRNHQGHSFTVIGRALPLASHARSLGCFSYFWHMHAFTMMIILPLTLYTECRSSQLH